MDSILIMILIASARMHFDARIFGEDSRENSTLRVQVGWRITIYSESELTVEVQTDFDLPIRFNVDVYFCFEPMKQRTMESLLSQFDVTTSQRQSNCMHHAYDTPLNVNLLTCIFIRSQTSSHFPSRSIYSKMRGSTSTSRPLSCSKRRLKIKGLELPCPNFRPRNDADFESWVSQMSPSESKEAWCEDGVKLSMLY